VWLVGLITPDATQRRSETMNLMTRRIVACAILAASLFGAAVLEARADTILRCNGKPETLVTE